MERKQDGGLHRKLPGGKAQKVELQKSRLAAESREACQMAPGVLSMESLSNLHTEGEAGLGAEL